MAKPAISILIALLVQLASPASGSISSPFNNHILREAGNDIEYRFLVGGHLYGSSSNQHSVFPAPALLANLDDINALQPEFFMALGDIIRKPAPQHIDPFLTHFARKLQMPLFNAVGNHDVLSSRKSYTDKFGPTFFHFEYGRELFVILDTVLDYTRIAGGQLTFFRDTIRLAKQRDDIRTVFIFSHNPIWSNMNPDKLVRTYPDDSNYEKELYPLLLDLAQHKNVYWFSDDIGGGPDPLSFFFFKDTLANITYLATGIGDNGHDALLEVTVNRETGVTFRPVSLTGEASLPLEYYSVAHWRKYVEQSQKNTSTTKKIYRRFRNSHFRLGAAMGGAATVGLGLLVIYIKRSHRK